MKSIKELADFLSSTKFVELLILIFTALILTTLLSSRYYLHHSVIENGISKKDVIANKTVRIIDTEKTQKLKNEIIKKVLPILVPVQDDFIKNNLKQNIAKISEIRAMQESVTFKTDELLLFFNVTGDNSQEERCIKYLLQMPQQNFDKVSQVAEDTLYSILNKGISDADIQDNIDEIIKSNLPEYISFHDLEAVHFLINSIIAPNIITDEEATEMSRKNALNSVKPVYVTFKAGSKIVSAGQVVSKLQRDALKECGYNVIQLNFSGILGVLVLVLLALITCTYHIDNYEPAFKRKAYYSLLSLLMIFIASCAMLLPPFDYYIFLLPFTTFAILIAIFMNSKTSLISSIALLCAVALALQLELLLTVIFAFGIFATLFAMKKLDYSKRIDLFRVGIITSAVFAIGLTGAFFLEYNFEDITSGSYGKYLLALISNGLISSIIALGLLPLLEACYKIPTQYGLLELANSNHPLLQKLQEKAPGTYHHSRMVAELAEAAAEAVGANAALTKIGSYYHDVGKINRPLFFIENQSYYGIDNPHEQFSPKFSKMVITTHPKDGVEIAKDYKISPVIYPFILEHHGDSIASYFYNEAIKQEGAENVSEEEYRYNAPRPSTKESAIVMLADSVESAVRSLKNASFEEIEAKVNAVINGKLLDSQLSDSPLSLKDLRIITATFNRILKGMQHKRIKYHEDIENIQANINDSEAGSSEN